MKPHTRLTLICGLLAASSSIAQAQPVSLGHPWDDVTTDMFEPHNSCARARIALSNQLGILDRYTHDVPPSVDTSQTARSACQAAEYYAMNQFRSISNAFGMSPTSGNATRLAWANVRMCQLNEDCRFGTEFARIMRDHTEAQLAYINSIRHVSTCAIAQLRLEVTNECEGESTFPVFS